MALATLATAEEDVEPEPEHEVTPEEKYNSQVNFAGAQLEVLPLYDFVVPGFVNRVPILFQFVTGTDSSLRREAFSLVVVLDVSGSMAGGKLSSCKAAVAQLIDSACDDDMLSLVTYDHSVSIVFESIRCGDSGARKSMHDKLALVETGGSTDLYGGLLAGYELLQRQVGGANKHIFLLSDGEANAGPVQHTDAILRAVSEWGEKIPILSYGIGAGFNEKLMSPLGQVHRGSHYFYITDAASIEKLVGKGIRALTGAVARNVRLNLRPVSRGLWLPECMIEGNCFPLIRERSVVQFLVELEVRPDLPGPTSLPRNDEPNSTGWLCGRRRKGETHAARARMSSLELAWEVQGFPLLCQSSGTVALALAPERGPKNQQVRAFLDIKRGCELRRTATGSEEARKSCEEALRLFEGCLEHDRFGFAQEWTVKTKALLNDARLWRGGAASEEAAKQLGVSYARHAATVEEEEEEEEMDFDLFG